MRRAQTVIGSRRHTAFTQDAEQNSPAKNKAAKSNIDSIVEESSEASEM